MWLVVGLGNPGSEYANTRHNAGFMVVRLLAREWGVQLKSRTFRSKLAEVERNGVKLVLALPQTYMNLSGLAVKDLIAGFKTGPENLLVIYDDLDINLGEIRIRPKGSPGSHKGLKSIVKEIGTQVFPRIRVGIGPKPVNQEAADYVLTEFSEEEKLKLKPALMKACEAVEMILAGEIEKAMNNFNRRRD
ncbi:MAG: aminoacyl-tRNA hydrolase [Candidatus Saccharicenans sp.]|nr:MAG: aminoacyl-tRNA hydrolase [Candidatus Aminicenantes bacterium]HEK85502.1 aminoacyl-tRNA hydrolase [Candidatus Aminicenantes bacterium]